MNISDMSARKRRDTVNLALGFVLQDIAQPVGTSEIVEALARRLDVTGKSERDLLSRTVVALAPLYPEAQRGEGFLKYGRTMRRWVWSPRGQRPAADYSNVQDHTGGHEEWEIEPARPPLTKEERIARVATDMHMTVEEYRAWLADPK